MCGPTITALSDASVVVYGGQQVLADTWYFETGLPDKLDTGEGITSAELRFWSLIAKLAKDVPLKPQNVGRFRTGEHTTSRTRWPSDISI